MTPRQNALGRLLQRHREELGYSRPALGEAVGMSPGTIEGWELGRVSKPPFQDVVRLARYLRIPSEDIIATAFAGDDAVKPLPAGASRKESKKARSSGGGEPEVALILHGQEAFGWTDASLATQMGTDAAQVVAWREGRKRMGVQDLLRLQALFSIASAGRARSGGRGKRARHGN